jgi:hypothetical protein
MSELVFECCDPRDREAELKDLFARNGKAVFAEVFDRAYRVRAQHGQRSWIALQDGRAVMHIAVTPMPFVGGGRTQTGGILSDLMVDDGYRDFWAPVRLLRKLVADVKKAGEIDFLLSTTTTEAESVFKAGGFKPFGTLRRYVLPLSRLYLGVARMRASVRRSRAQQSAYSEWESTAAFSRNTGGSWRPRPDATFYETRIPRFEFTDGKWLTIADRSKAAPAWALMARNPEHGELRLADAFWDEAGVGLGQVVHAAARWGKSQRFKKFAIGTVQESRVAGQLERFGFFARDVRSLLLINQISPNSPPPIEDWFLLGFALSGW